MKIVKIKSGEKIPPFAQFISKNTHTYQSGDFSESEEIITLLVPEDSDWKFLAQKVKEHKPKNKKKSSK